MPAGPKRPGFYLGVLVTGFLIGGFLSALMARFLPDSPARSFFTYSLTPAIGPVSVNLLVVSFTIGVGLNISVMSLIGVALAYYAARSLF
ncbi:MAG TPA: DUF4321 domain-containing protein [Gemmatimonadales bacterium]|jgi:hypothetical protein|nr:DUF4321 domain-containing protein [Gemmatimonadales bacterium]